MKHILLMAVWLTACGPTSGQYDVNVRDSEHTIHVVNPIIEYCERLYPEVLFPIEVEREQGIVECMKLCQESGDCEVSLPDSFNGEPITTLPVSF